MRSLVEGLSYKEIKFWTKRKTNYKTSEKFNLPQNKSPTV